MKRSTEIVIKFISAVAFGILLSVFLVYCFIFLRCFNESKIIPEFTQYDIMHVEINGKGTDSVNARFSLCDTSGKEIAVIDRSWNGVELCVDFTSACFYDKKIMFPYKIYSSSEEKIGFHKGTILSNYYMEWGECLLLGSPCTERQRKAMYRLGAFALSQTTKIQNNFSRVQTINLSECKIGQIYYIITGSDGNLFLSQM